MKKVLLAILLAAGITASAQSFPQITNIPGRQKQSLDGQWKYIVDVYKTGYQDYRANPMPESQTFFADRSFYTDQRYLVEYDFDAAKEIAVPGDWNTQKRELYYYEGTVWYRTKFTQPKAEGKRYFLYFGAANYETVVGLNGHILGSHTGGFTPFNFEITDNLREGENSLVVNVDNTRHLNAVPTVNSDWWNYGGITRSVYVIETPETFIRDYSLQLRKEGEEDIIKGWVKLDGSQSSQQVTLSIPELGINKAFVTDGTGTAAFEFAYKAKPKSKRKLELWSPESPKLYDITFACGTDSVSDRIGFRTIEAQGSKLLLNGEQIFLKGICIHEESPDPSVGRAFSEEHARTLLGWAKEMGCNFVRLAHYPHNENMVRVAEQMGIMVWDEIPVYWTIAFDNPETYANAEQQLTDMIARDHNRANVIIWSVANETPLGATRLRFLTNLINKAREFDGTRLVSAAMEKVEYERGKMTCNDPLADVADLMSFNQYVGWYDGDADKCDRVSWSFAIEKPVIISEFGGGALAGRHGDRNLRFTEEYQEYLYQKNVQMLDRIPGLAGTTPWILKDFRTPKRMLDGIQDDYNRKGLISESGQKKKAFYVMRDWYSGK
ncbi:MAG: glycoside hydrolase family 2 TIM barrel-domain containing protein [Bacteroidia bacterium]|nr:glycoside hydrolase family 2 TIM barrel-domain containing protein [Bacteroidia bacterium]